MESLDRQQLSQLLGKLDVLSDRLLAWLPQPLQNPDWQQVKAAVYLRDQQGARLVPVKQISALALTDLQNIDEQKRRIQANTEQFLAGKPANNVLLSGARGTGKSSLVKALLTAYADRGLRIIEMDKRDLADLPAVIDLIAERSERFIIFTDDLSFEALELSYKALKSVLDGSIHACGKNVLIYATSNRRHLLPEYMSDNLGYQHTEDGEVHPGEAVEEKISLSERFGLWLSFYPFDQEAYLAIVRHWLSPLQLQGQALQQAQSQALLWALERGGRSGRVAWQFASDYIGRNS